MGLFGRRQERREQEEHQRWETERSELQDMLLMARTFRGISAGEDPQIALNLKKGETLYAQLQGAALIEPQRGPGRYVGGYSGFSFKIAKGVRYHVGGSRCTYVRGDERPTPIDQGTVSITSDRVVFHGSKHAREWAYGKVLQVEHDEHLPWTAISVSNRQKVSGFLYDKESTVNVRFRLTLALAVFAGSVDVLIAQLESDLGEHDVSNPKALPR